MLKVKGDSMTGAGIFNDDIIVVNAQADAVNNDIVVALIDDDVTVKRIFSIRTTSRFMPKTRIILTSTSLTTHRSSVKS